MGNDVIWLLGGRAVGLVLYHMWQQNQQPQPQFSQAYDTKIANNETWEVVRGADGLAEKLVIHRDVKF